MEFFKVSHRVYKNERRGTYFAKRVHSFLGVPYHTEKIDIWEYSCCNTGWGQYITKNKDYALREAEKLDSYYALKEEKEIPC